MRETIAGGIPEKWGESIFDRGNELALEFLDLLPDGGEVLDFGCGIGRNALELARRGYRTSICDVVDEGVRYCEANARDEGLGNLSSVEFDGSRIGLGDACMDGVLAWSCLDHVTLPHSEELATELGRIARPGALLLVAFDEDKSDDPDSESRILEDGTHQYIGGKREGMLFRPYTNEEIRSLFADDWEIVRFVGKDPLVPRRVLFRRSG
jgi:SAM-dependent methyltransferase